MRTRREQRDGRASIVLTVEDNGKGIPAYALPDIFDAFVTTRLDAHGTGLGLTRGRGHHPSTAGPSPPPIDRGAARASKSASPPRLLEFHIH